MKNFNEAISNLKQGQETFSRNISLSKTAFFGLTYEDITRYTSIPQPTMYSYDKYWVSPYISVAKQIAEFYCADLDTLCHKEISFYTIEQFNMLKRFIVRVGGSFNGVKVTMSEWIDKQSHVDEAGIYDELCNQLKIEIARLNDERRSVEINKDERVAENFTRNFNSLHSNLGVSYRKISAALDISIGNLTRLKKGGEPMLETVIKLSAFFGVTIEQMIATQPNFNYQKLQNEVGKFKIQFGTFPSEDVHNYLYRMSANLLSKKEAKELVVEVLN